MCATPMQGYNERLYPVSSCDSRAVQGCESLYMIHWRMSRYGSQACANGGLGPPMTTLISSGKQSDSANHRFDWLFSTRSCIRARYSRSVFHGCHIRASLRHSCGLRFWPHPHSRGNYSRTTLFEQSDCDPTNNWIWPSNIIVSLEHVSPSM